MKYQHDELDVECQRNNLILATERKSHGFVAVNENILLQLFLISTVTNLQFS